jgi:thiol-disulfide isomerase/thioredoxin
MKLKLLIVTTIILFLSLSLFAQSEAIKWQKDYKKAVAEARESGRPLLLDFTAVWCKPCKAMDEQFWILPDVVNSVKPFIAVKIDYDDQKSLVEKYNVSAIPFVAFTDPLGNMITFRKGFSGKNAKELNAIFDEMPKDFSPLKKYYEAVETNKNDGKSWIQIADVYREAKMLYLSNTFYLKALKTKEIQADIVQKERIMTIIGVNAFGYNAYNGAIEYFENYLKTFPTGTNREGIYYLLVLSNLKIDKQKNSIKFLELLKKDFADSKYISLAETAIQEAKNKKDKNNQ